MVKKIDCKLVGKATVSYDFQNKTVVVTGAGRGLGCVTASLFLEAGANVVYLSRTFYPDVQNETKAYGNKALFIRVDVSDKSQVQRAISQAVKKFKTVDILINNAGIAKKGKIEEVAVRDWDEVMAVNVRSQFLCIQACLPFMKKMKYGKIVNVSSIAGRDKSILLGAAYSTSKAAIIGLTRHVASEVAAFGINVNCVCPGQHETPMLDNVLTESMKKVLLKRIPLGYIAQAEQIAEVILFLSSERASYMTAAIVDVNGGQL